VNYAEHVKDEIIDGLTYTEAVTVLRGAADLARDEARRQLGKLRSAGPSEGYDARVENWCSGEARETIQKFIADHDSNHAAFDIALYQAKLANGI
jgi:hypothetical protein